MENIRVFNPEESYSAEDFKDGIVLLIDKPLTWSSFDVVNKIRILFRIHLGIRKIKVGHAGTLDPLATGLLILCTGKATKQIPLFTGMDKEYVAHVKFGATRPSYDLETEIDEEHDCSHVSEAQIKEVLKDFLGKQLQTPPLFSAIKVNGQRAYEHARKGKDVVMSQREIEIHEAELISFNESEAVIRILCSKGTYIRSFAHDLGKSLNTGAYLSGLVRTASGSFRNEKAISPQEFEEKLKTISSV
ncbi:tRNA pseudouridine(55) synthase TruB [Alkalitalea saponilacus]|uniref:tRNA pseudouridine synthase B n=1 Tax=Alkalitalea saponilacus TaxID=889453 RepID=A0A1T5E6R5_9BACT|nr:tRNA pseudouridine(55) synthase TruB [Alkalitalea saponilacus]ASB49095.1 tRNA pseudouridine(55) synthase TruB [Alkalitalea saponilacus]SKB79473.1 tRNA pseudouridine55 synthase [Alkalitalea saponilacus]